MIVDQPLLLGAVVAASAAAAFWLDHRYRWASRLGASLLAIIFGALLSNAGLVPFESPVYDAVTGPVTSLAIAWLLLAVHVSDLRRAGPRMLAAFGLALAGTAAGALAGGLIFGGALGDAGWRLSGTLMGTYSGGSLNFVGVGRALELPEGLFAGAAAADNLTTAVWLAACLAAPALLGRWFPAPPGKDGGAGAAGGDDGPAAGEPDGGDHEHPFFAGASISVLGLSLLVALGLGLLVAAELTARVVPAVPEVLWLTTFALAVGHLGPVSRLEGAMQLGNYALHLFFVVIGIFSRLSEILEVGLAVLAFTLLVVGVHGLVVFGLGRLARLDLGVLTVASQAAVGGPSTALAIAVAHEWRVLVLPGIAVGLLGYAVGNYLGVALGQLLRMVGG